MSSGFSTNCHRSAFNWSIKTDSSKLLANENSMCSMIGEEAAASERRTRSFRKSDTNKPKKVEANKEDIF